MTEADRPADRYRHALTARRLLGAAGALAAGAAGVVLVQRARFERANARRVGDLLAASTGASGRTVGTDDLAGLPAPVRRYLSHALTEGQDHVSTVRLAQRGEFRLGDADAPWKPLEATQTVTTGPPGFVWDATIDVAPFVPVRVVDQYRDGRGFLRAKLFSTVTVADAAPGPELDAGELLRYLGESVWYPTALLPGNGVEWEPIDDRSARATLTHRGTTASLVFHFEDSEVVRVSGERPYRRPDGSYDLVPWTGYWRDYRCREGMAVPTEGEVEWNLPDGDLPYWRARLTEVEYE
jgi:hypothetical protein